MCGTPGYKAPEIWEGKGYNGEKVDTFALGVMLFTMVSGLPPFFEAKSKDVFYRFISKNRFDMFLRAHMRTNPHLSYSEELKSLI